ncbi:MFS transporter [Archaeoglobus veneficus]|uniref:Major facilitator superfamily MFS_1 n=1 Tax=Archaeoglobus veneficus (strain DSM 11195 / SNP6) TaxID=693661 RepID=F2KP91_ARCVS|nr:MFS transporter [Archaeoglobus veneficus]AEA47495.1 major facilitator superfamily MFS_1 [Archaeoglobus veneficus SNP6]
MPELNSNLYTIFAVTLMGVIGVSILTPAFPQIGAALGIGRAEVAMLVTAFTLPGIFFAPLMGILADRYGRKKVLVPSLFLFSIAGTLCAFADFKTMLLLRFIQGIGGSALTALSATMIGDIYEGIERARILGYNASVLTIGITAYQAIGGILAYFDWRYPFLTFGIAIPVGIAAMLMPHPDVRSSTPISSYFRGMARVVSGRLLFEFASGAAVFIILYGAFLTFLPFLLKEKFMANSIMISAVQASMSAFTAIFSYRLAHLVERFGSIGAIKAGFAAYCISMLVIPFLPSYYLFFAAALLFGFAHGSVLPALQNLVISTAPNEHRAAVMTAYGSTIRIGQTTGPLVFGLLSLNAVFVVAALIAFSFFLAYNFIDKKFQKGFIQAS